jgi:hypothetical protein
VASKEYVSNPVEVVVRIGDTLETTLRAYSHEFDAQGTELLSCTEMRGYFPDPA